MYTFTKEKLNDSLSFDEFMAYAKQVLESENKVSPYDNKAYAQFTEVNYKRAEKAIRNFQIDKKLYNIVSEGIEDWTWVLINEPWCSDGSFIQPVLYAMALASAGAIDFKIVLRDSNLDIMNSYLTNGGMAIPKLVCLDKNLNEIGTWGPRPKKLQDEFLKWKKEDNFDTETKIKKINRWYIKNKSEAIQTEFIDLIKEWKKK